MTPSVVFVPAPASGASLRFNAANTTSGVFTSNSAPTSNQVWIGPDTTQFQLYNSSPVRTNTAKRYVELLFRVNTSYWLNGSVWNNHFQFNNPRVEVTLSSGASFICDPAVNAGDTFSNRVSGTLVRLRANKGTGSATSFWSEWQNQSSGATCNYKVFYIP